VVAAGAAEVKQGQPAEGSTREARAAENKGAIDPEGRRRAASHERLFWPALKTFGVDTKTVDETKVG